VDAPAAGLDPPGLGLMQRFVRYVELWAGFSLGLIALLIFTEIALRALLREQLPDAYQIANQFQGMAIFWGFATATYAGRHIAVDVVWEMCPPRLALVMDTFADLVSALFFAALAVMLYFRTDSLMRSGEVTNVMKLALWPFVAIGAIGIVCCVILGITRIIMRFQGRAPVETGFQVDG
jgi:TRAP-type C4-dicarboxylate transport system permease small subunit